jgi:pimeloyl-ACP methyl ester carboxylesterase
MPCARAKTIPPGSFGSTCAGRSSGMSDWRPDACLPGFEALEIAFADDYDGPVVATLVRLPAREAPRGAVLYVHGFADYFFQRHMAERFAAEGYAFYALDLRKHGRSLRAHQHPNFCKSVTEYFPTSPARSTRSASRCCSPDIPPAAWCARCMRTRASGAMCFARCG